MGIASVQRIGAVASRSMTATIPRGKPAPCPPWWIELANKTIDTRGIKQSAIAEAEDVSPFKISRCLAGHNVTYETVEAISRFLDIPSPFKIADTEAMALESVVSTTPLPTDTDDQVIRKNLTRFREAAGLDLLGAADASGIPYETLRAYELGDITIPNTALKPLGAIYGHRAGDFFDVEPPPSTLDETPGIWWRARPEIHALITESDRRRLDDLMREIWDRYRPEKKRVLDHFTAAKKRRKR